MYINDNKKIKWCSLQPLTGGMYFGTETAVGHPAEFIISYPGFDKPRFNKDGQLVDAGNEYSLIEYLKKKDRMVPYYQFERMPFQTDMNTNVQLLKDGEKVDAPDYSDMDLVVAVPVCSGLSSATLGASDETKDARNCNMKYLTHYALGVIKPKVYVFENAPRLVGNPGAKVRAQLEDIAKQYDYTVVYYRTDTKWHDNCQMRPRTFVYFFKNDSAHQGVPVLGYEHNNVSVEEFLNRIPDNSTQQVSLPIDGMNRLLLDYIKERHGSNWREELKYPSILADIIARDELDKWIEFSDKQDIEDKLKQNVKKYVAHIKHKLSMKMGFYATSPVINRKHAMPAAMFKTIPALMHYKEDRLFTMREWLSAMGMPYDFEMQGEHTKFFPKIGQNVPARTAQWIVSEALRVINNWDSVERTVSERPLLVNNDKQTTSTI